MSLSLLPQTSANQNLPFAHDGIGHHPVNTHSPGEMALVEGFNNFQRFHYRPGCAEAPVDCYLEAVENGQHPHYFILGCIDSRVGAVFNMHAGQALFKRNMGNILSERRNGLFTRLLHLPRYPAIAAGTWAAVEFAVDHLKVPHLVIVGHSGCGGMKALIGGQAKGAVKDWLNQAKSVTSEARRLYMPTNPETLQTAVEKANVRHGALALESFLSERTFDDFNPRPQIHAFWFDMKAGHLYRLTDTENGHFELVAGQGHDAGHKQPSHGAIPPAPRPQSHTHAQLAS